MRRSSVRGDRLSRELVNVTLKVGNWWGVGNGNAWEGRLVLVLMRHLLFVWCFRPFVLLLVILKIFFNSNHFYQTWIKYVPFQCWLWVPTLFPLGTAPLCIRTHSAISKHNVGFHFVDDHSSWPLFEFFAGFSKFCAHVLILAEYLGLWSFVDVNTWCKFLFIVCKFTAHKDFQPFLVLIQLNSHEIVHIDHVLGNSLIQGSLFCISRYN